MSGYILYIMLTCSPGGIRMREVCLCAADKQQAVASGEPACMLLLSLGFPQAAIACNKLSSGTGEACCSAWGCSQQLLLTRLDRGHVMSLGILLAHMGSHRLHVSHQQACLAAQSMQHPKPDAYLLVGGIPAGEACRP